MGGKPHFSEPQEDPVEAEKEREAEEEKKKTQRQLISRLKAGSGPGGFFGGGNAPGGKSGTLG